MRLTADPIQATRGGRLALSAPAFCVAAGEAATLRGPNGAGKSTLLRALAGLLPLSSGDARLGEVRLSADPEAFQSRIAYAGHLDAVKLALTVRRNLVAWAEILGGDPASVDAALDRFSLTHIADAPAAYCSAGQKRRLGLARLLVVRRPVWLLDEPTVSLDAASSAAFTETMAQHCAGGGLAIAATHVDLGLPAGPKVEIVPPAIRAADRADPFLEGAWA